MHVPLALQRHPTTAHAGDMPWTPERSIDPSETLFATLGGCLTRWIRFWDICRLTHTRQPHDNVWPPPAPTCASLHACIQPLSWLRVASPWYLSDLNKDVSGTNQGANTHHACRAACVGWILSNIVALQVADLTHMERVVGRCTPDLGPASLQPI